jgi:hypothetical protein
MQSIITQNNFDPVAQSVGNAMAAYVTLEAVTSLNVRFERSSVQAK